MKKLFLLTIALTYSFSAWASPNCEKLAIIATSNASNYGDTTTAHIQGKKNTRIYFYSAPSEQCKSQIFIIPNDKITILQDILSNGVMWSYVSYTSKNDLPQITQGWIKKFYIGEMTFN
ncbi:hypothetical protein [Acinetobacter sp. MD2]|uniref:hypothetical protein n=1 Tax=Acinetobacter sp. MD2 TaxID=2600066 RepID=UPI002D1F39AB|nr:hypothetical protein [Acinetobacter sp. MD2]MEB3766381.1 hypothetical protein [Acinetobacter sp. MD2]